MKRAWFQRIRVWGMSNLGLWGERPMCCHPVVICHLPCLTQPLQCFDFVSWGSYCMRKRGHGGRQFWEAVVSSDGTHAQQRTFVSLTPDLHSPVLLMVCSSFSHAEKVWFFLTRRSIHSHAGARRETVCSFLTWLFIRAHEWSCSLSRMGGSLAHFRHAQ